MKATKNVRGISILPAHTKQGLNAGQRATTLDQMSADRAGRPLVRHRASSGKRVPGPVTLVPLFTLVVFNESLFCEIRRMHLVVNMFYFAPEFHNSRSP